MINYTIINIILIIRITALESPCTTDNKVHTYYKCMVTFFEKIFIDCDFIPLIFLTATYIDRPENFVL